MKQILNVDSTSDLTIISQRCNHFIQESNQHPLLKNLSIQYKDIHRVKARKRNLKNEFTESFNQAFDKISDLAQRAIFANGRNSFTVDKDPNFEPFYIFPLNGYKYMYSTEVEHSSLDYKQVFEVMFEQFGEDKGKTIITDILKFAYKQDCLAEGIEKGSEIILYNIPYYYSVRATSVPNYTQLLSNLSDFRYA